MTEDRRDQLLEAYQRYRVEDQMAYYGRRSGDYERARRLSVWITAVLLVLAAFFGALGAADANRRAVWAFTAAALAALGTAVATFESAFDFERLSRQFSETGDAVALRNAKGPKPDEGVPGFVTAIEEILGSEVDRWSHQALATLGATAEESTPGSDTGPSTDPPVTSVPPGPG